MKGGENYTHILNIDIDKNLDDIKKNELLIFIFGSIHDKVINKNILNTNVSIKWIVSDETTFLTYYTNVNGMLGDRAVYLHTEMLLNDIKNKTNIVNFNFNVTKPLMRQICML